MTKKATGKKTSKGIVGVSSAASRGVRQSYTPLDKLAFKRQAWEKGRKVFLTIENPDKNATNRPFIRVPMETIYGGTYKERRLGKEVSQ